MSLTGILESVQEIKSDAAKFFEFFTRNTHHISNLTQHVEKGVMHEGEHAVVGSIIHWDLIHDGELKHNKQVIEAIDDENHSITLRVIDGRDVLDLYKYYKIVLQVTDKEHGTGSLVRWTFEYERVNASVPAPTRYIDIVFHMTEDIDKYIQEEAKA